MTDWYVSSAAYATYTAFATSHAYSVGDIIVPTAPAAKAKWVFRCTVAGTSSTEPGWTSTNNGTNTSGTATFQNITGQSAFFWTAAAGDMPTLNARILAAGDRVFVSSDHTETIATSSDYGTGNFVSYGNVQFLCVNRAGSTPPVAADLSTGASVTVTGSGSQMNIRSTVNCYFYGISFSALGNGSFGLLTITLNDSGTKTVYMKNCAIVDSSDAQPLYGYTATVLDNTTLQVNLAAIAFRGNSPWFFTWINTSGAIAGSTIPTSLFSVPNTIPVLPICRGVDFSALTTSFYVSSNVGMKCYFESCKIASGVSRYTRSVNTTNLDEVVLTNCYDGTNIISERHTNAGDVTTEFSIYLTGGAQDDVGNFSHKMVSTTAIDKYVHQLCGFWMDMYFETLGVSKTAIVEIVSSTALNTDEIALYIEYLGTAGSSVSSFANSFPATVLTAPTALTTSTSSWNALPSTPVKQQLRVTFTPQQAGRLRGQVRLGKASTTLYVNPVMVIS